MGLKSKDKMEMKMLSTRHWKRHKMLQIKEMNPIRRRNPRNKSVVELKNHS